MSDYKELMERLRKDKWHVAPIDGRMAADAIEALQAENERLCIELQRAKDTACRLSELAAEKRGEVDRLREYERTLVRERLGDISE